MPFPIPLNLQPSTSTGTHVKCHYIIQVECDLPGAIDLQIDVPTPILAPQWLFSTMPPPPPTIILPPDVSFRPPWENDEKIGTCPKCSASFGLFKRKHHCRHCGKVFCDNCTKKEVKIPNLGYVENPVKVCDACNSIVSQSGGVLFETAPVIQAAPSVEYGQVDTAVYSNQFSASAPPLFPELADDDS